MIQAKCTECGDCMPACPNNSLVISSSTYAIIDDKCVGCGDCIPVCQNEGNCIEYTRELYTVLSSCKEHECESECKSACPYGAITRHRGVAVIDQTLCQKCGDCVAACPNGDILPAQVALDQDNCETCGKCYAVCTHKRNSKKHQRRLFNCTYR